MSEDYKKGLLFSILTAIISGFSIFYNKLIIVKGIDPQIFNVIKNGGVAVLIFLFFMSTDRVIKLKKINISQWRSLFLLGIIGGGIPFILYFDGLKTVSAINANLIHKSMFIWVALLATPILREKLSGWQIIGYLFVAWVTFFIGGFTRFSLNTGELMILTATLFWSLENILAKNILKNVDSNIAAWSRMFFGILVISGFVVWQNHLSLFLTLTPRELLPIAGSILLLTGYVTSWYKALSLAPATAVTSVLVISTPITNILSAIFITHNFPQVQIINLIGSVAGIILITLLTSKSAEWKREAAVEA